MDNIKYHVQVKKEIETVKERLKSLITHNLSRGLVHEYAIRKIFEEKLPENYGISRGFIITDDWESTEIDILIYDKSFPLLFKSFDLVVVTPDAVRAIIEVKTTLDAIELRESVRKLADILEEIQKYRNGVFSTVNDQYRFSEVFSGVLGIEGDEIKKATLENIMNDEVRHNRDRVVNHISVTENIFIKYFDISDQGDQSWHIYKFGDPVSHGYFLSNCLFYLKYNSIVNNTKLWFPYPDKNPYFRWKVDLG